MLFNCKSEHWEKLWDRLSCQRIPWLPEPHNAWPLRWKWLLCSWIKMWDGKPVFPSTFSQYGCLQEMEGLKKGQNGSQSHVVAMYIKRRRIWLLGGGHHLDFLTHTPSRRLPFPNHLLLNQFCHLCCSLSSFAIHNGRFTTIHLTTVQGYNNIEKRNLQLVQVLNNHHGISTVTCSKFEHLATRMAL